MDGSNYSGDLSKSNGRSGSSSSSSSSRRGKKGSSSDKPRQPQRGLGVAQLEQIRLHSQLSGAYLPSLHGPLHPKEEEAREEIMAFSPPAVTSSSIASSSSFFGPPHSLMVGFGDMERDVRYRDAQSYAATASTSAHMMTHGIKPNENNFYHSKQQMPKVTLPLLRQTDEDWVNKKRRQGGSDSAGSSSWNSDLSDAHDLDLDLKLSL